MAVPLARNWVCVPLDTSHHLLRIWRRGLNLAPIVGLPYAFPYRVAHYAAQLCRARVLVRNVHYPAKGAVARHDARCPGGQTARPFYVLSGRYRSWVCAYAQVNRHANNHLHMYSALVTTNMLNLRTALLPSGSKDRLPKPKPLSWLDRRASPMHTAPCAPIWQPEPQLRTRL